MVKKATYLEVTAWHVNVTPNIAFQGSRKRRCCVCRRGPLNAGVGCRERTGAMDAEISERMFASYLDGLGLIYKRHFRVRGDKNVDFLVEGSPSILCDVKEVRPSAKAALEIDAYAHLREDLSDLRRKFGPDLPAIPIVLVTVNFSGRMFTGFSVARAMLGDVGADFSS